MAASELGHLNTTWWTGFLFREYIYEFTERHVEDAGPELLRLALIWGFWRGPLPADADGEIQELYAKQQHDAAAWMAHLTPSAIDDARQFLVAALDVDMPYILGTCAGQDWPAWIRVQTGLAAVLACIVPAPGGQNVFVLPDFSRRVFLAEPCRQAFLELQLDTQALQRFRAEALIHFQAFVAGE